jgi:hypothetical protein
VWAVVQAIRIASRVCRRVKHLRTTMPSPA